MESSAHASGKLILVGEHAVVYGVPAIALGIDRGAHARARAASETTVRVRLAKGEPMDATADDGSPLGRAFAAVLSSIRATRDVRHVAVEVDTDLPAGAGLGCSAALGLSIARAVCELGRPATDDEAREHAMAWERVFHGTPSGIDAAVAALGGTLLFTRDVASGASTIERIDAATPLVLAVGHSGSASSTKAMVESVARQRAQRPDVTEKTFEAIGVVVRNARLAIEAGDTRALGKLLDMNQMLLAGLLLSTREIESMCEIARDQGALGAKLTGAGGGGCAIALVDTRGAAERVLAAWSREGWVGFVAEAAAPRGRMLLRETEAQP
jgi:mevalonate kinase